MVVGPFPPPVHGAARITAAATDLLRNSGCEVFQVDSGCGNPSMPLDYHLKRVLAHARAVLLIVNERNSARLLYVGGAGGAGLWYQFFVVAAASMFGYRIFFHHHSFSYIRDPRLVMYLIARLPLHGGSHIFLTDGMASSFLGRYKCSQEVEVFTNSTFLHFRSDVTPRTPPARGEIVLGHLSNLSFEKGLGVVLETIGEVRRAGINARLDLAGPLADAEAREVLEATLRHNDTAVRYIGALEPSDVPYYLSEIDLFLFPSTYRNEAEPLVVLEAIHMNVPVVAFDVGCLRDTIGSAGICVPPGVSFAEAVIRVASILAAVDDPRAQLLRDHVAEEAGARTEAAGRARQVFVDLLFPEGEGHE